MMRPRVQAALLALAAAATALAAVLGGCNGQTAPIDNGVTCIGYQTLCDSNCVDLQTDPNNCGSCGMSCDPSKVCTRGQCVDICAASQTACPLGGAGDGGTSVFCVDLKTDNANCGTCGKPCAPEQTCLSGSCKSLCSPGQTGCMPEGGGAPYCVTTQSDNSNCGSCGRVCGAQQVCMAGVCVDECLPNQKACPDPEGGAPFCADVQTDNDNCGSCGKVCGVLQSCTMGMCTGACEQTQTLCAPDASDDGGPYCADIMTDSQNCGGCGNVCPPLQPLCTGGQCESTG
jgi:hypothetical protein